MIGHAQMKIRQPRRYQSPAGFAADNITGLTWECRNEILALDSDEALGRKIIYYFTRYNNQPVEIGEIAEKLFQRIMHPFD
ncbi:MAG: hypothetical protein GY749_46680 [Desulfobacteraceae bacterium]|nr:hypothetical protein [Desulfobacteraceae bacterium]